MEKALLVSILTAETASGVVRTGGQCRHWLAHCATYFQQPGQRQRQQSKRHFSQPPVARTCKPSCGNSLTMGSWFTAAQANLAATCQPVRATNQDPSRAHQQHSQQPTLSPPDAISCGCCSGSATLMTIDEKAWPCWYAGE